MFLSLIKSGSFGNHQIFNTLLGGVEKYQKNKKKQKNIYHNLTSKAFTF